MAYLSQKLDINIKKYAKKLTVTSIFYIFLRCKAFAKNTKKERFI